MRNNRFALGAALLATLAFALPTAAPAAAVPKGTPPSMRNSFRIGTSGVLCTGQARTVSPNLVSMFDRGYRIVCRDAAAPVGRLLALRTGKDDPVARVLKNAETPVKCEAPKPAVVGKLHVELRDCVDSNQLAYKSYSYKKGNTVYIADGLGGYDSALQIGLQEIAADDFIKGEVQVATTEAGDPAAFARVQAGTLDSESALQEAYARNGDGAYAEADEFFQALVERDSSNTKSADAKLSEYLANDALQQSNQKNFTQAEALFQRASTPSALADPVTGRMLRNYYAMHYLNQNKIKEAIDELSKPVADIAVADSRDAQLSTGKIDDSVADDLNRESNIGSLGGGLDNGLTPVEYAQIFDAYAIFYRGVAYRINKDYAKAQETFAQADAAMQAIRDGKLGAVDAMRSNTEQELALINEIEGKNDEAQKLYADALQSVEIAHPNTATSLGAQARYAGFLSRHGQDEQALKIYGDVIVSAENLPGALTTVRNLLRPYFRLLAERAAKDPQSVALMFKASQSMLRPGIASTQALLARQLSAGDDEAASLFRQSVTLSRYIARAQGDVARYSANSDPANRPALEEANTRLAKYSTDQTIIQAKLAQFPRYKVLSPKTMTVEELQKGLNPGDGYFKLTVVAPDVYAMFVTRDVAKAWKLDVTDKNLEDMVGQLRDSIVKIENGQMATYPFDIVLARKLYLAMMGPVDAEIHKTTNFIYEPDGALLKLPANLLPIDQSGVDSYLARIKDPKGDEYDFRGIAWLGRDRDVSTVVSPRSFVDGRGVAASKGSKGYLGLGENSRPSLNPFFVPPPSQSDPCAWPLSNWNNPISSAELHLASGIIGTDQSKLITGADFSDSTIEGLSDLSNYRIIHFATHGLVTAPRPECPAQPALLTSFGGGTSDGLLSFKEIFDLKLDADVVVLSACDTAGMATVAATRDAGVTTGGNFALDGLVRAFVGAGARTVIASHWPIPDDYNATKRLITGLFTAPPGTPMATAMRKAQIGLMDDANTSHPYYWSAFAIVGDGERPLLPAPSAPGSAVQSTH